MSHQRIQVVKDGSVQPAAASEPLLTSSGTSLNGVLLEQHSLPAGELTATFPTHLIGVNIGPSYWQEWRTEGRHGRVLIPPGGVSLCSEREVWCTWDRRRTFLALAIQPDVMQRAAYEGVNHKVELRAEPNVSDPVVEAFMLAIYAEIRVAGIIEPLLGESLVTDLVAFLLRVYAVHRFKLRKFKGGIPRQRLLRVIDYIEASLERDLHIAELAAIAEMSPYYFGKLFKQSTGWTVHQYVMKRRLQRAIYLLSRSHVRISDIGASVGVPNPSQFTRLFHLQIGVTPRRYRADFF
jgi:AraC family transcriptional regulator